MRCTTALALLVAAATLSCGDRSPGGERVISGWRQVDLPGAVESIVPGREENGRSHLLAAGHRDGAAMLADIVDGRATFPFPLPVEDLAGGLRGLTSDGATHVVTTAGDPDADRPPRIWTGDEYVTYGNEVPTDEGGRAPVWLQPLLDGEEDLRAVGVLRDGDRWRVRAWESVDGWVPFDAPPLLYAADLPRTRELLTATTETTLMVAGPVSAGPGGPGRPVPQLWSASQDDPSAPSPWQREPLNPQPQGVSDLHAWDLGWWLAGHLDRRPLVFDFDGSGGALLDVPDVRLDAEHPTVLIASVNDKVPLLALQAEGGPGIWYWVGEEWHERPLPDGQLHEVAVVGELLYVVLNGDVWYAEAPIPSRR